MVSPDARHLHIGSPKVSVVVPTYNRATVLPRALNSVLAQTFRDFELIVVDDHSSDHTSVVAADFGKDARVTTLRHDRNMGQSRALNTGVAAARGEYVAFLDDDDVWLPTKLASQVDILDVAPADVALVYGWRYEMGEESAQPLRTVQQTLRGDIFERVLALDTPVPPSTWLVRTSVVRSLGGFDESLQRAKDVDFVCRLCQQGWRVDYVPSVVLVKYRHAQGQMVDETPENLGLRAAFIRQHLTKFAVELSERPESRARVHLRLARYEIRYRRIQGLLAVASAFLADPSAVTARIGFYTRQLYYLLRYATRTASIGTGRLSERTRMLY